MLKRYREWWATARSSLIVHRRMKWFWVFLTLVAWLTGWIYSVAFVSIMSMVALVLGSWSAEEASKTEVKQEEADASDL